MTVQQKLDAFAKRIKDNIDTKQRQEAKEIQETILQAVQSAENDARRASNEQLRIEIAKLERESNKKVYAASTEARQKLFEIKEQLKSELLYELENRLREFVKSHEYKPFLQTGLQSVQTEAFSTVVVMPQDADITLPNLATETSEEDFIGGFKLLSADKRVLADYSLLTKLGELSDEDLWD